MALSTPPAFLSLTRGTNPIEDPFDIIYNHLDAKLNDIGTHTITYTVTMKEYTHIGITGTFVFTLISNCDPTEIGTLTEKLPYEDQVQKTLNLLDANSYVEFKLPTYTVSNDACFTY